MTVKDGRVRFTLVMRIIVHAQNSRNEVNMRTYHCDVGDVTPVMRITAHARNSRNEVDMRTYHCEVFGFVRVLFVEVGAPAQLRWVKSWIALNDRRSAHPISRLTFSRNGAGMIASYAYHRPADKLPKRLTYRAHPH